MNFPIQNFVNIIGWRMRIANSTVLHALLGRFLKIRNKLRTISEYIVWQSRNNDIYMINFCLFQYFPDISDVSLDKSHILSPIFFFQNINIIWIKFNTIIQTIFAHFFQNVLGNRSRPWSQFQNYLILRALPVQRCTQSFGSSLIGWSQRCIG